jgi:hypothetical protein
MNASIMRMTRGYKLPAVCICIALMFTSLSANAALGSNVASVLKDQTALGATVKMTTHDGYTDYALTLPNGGFVHEFVSPSGLVFEITWSKRGSRPDMNQLLGDYVSHFSGKTNGGTPTSRHADRVDSDFELHSKVVNRYFSGTAHIPTLIPATLSGPVPLPVEAAK